MCHLTLDEIDYDATWCGTTKLTFPPQKRTVIGLKVIYKVVQHHRLNTKIQFVDINETSRILEIAVQEGSLINTSTILHCHILNLLRLGRHACSGQIIWIRQIILYFPLLRFSSNRKRDMNNGSGETSVDSLYVCVFPSSYTGSTRQLDKRKAAHWFAPVGVFLGIPNLYAISNNVLSCIKSEIFHNRFVFDYFFEIKVMRIIFFFT